MNQIGKIIRSLIRFGDSNGTAYHAISNQIWLWNIALTLMVVPIIGALFVLYGDLIGTQRWRYLVAYLSVPVGIAVVQAGLFWWGNGSFSRRSTALHLLIVSNCSFLWIYSLLSGEATKIHFVIPTLAALPFYFFRRTIHAKAWRTKTVWCTLILFQFLIALFFLPQWRGFLTLPKVATAVIGQLTSGLVIIIALTYSAYFWWQFGITRFILNFWAKLSLIGVPAEISGADRKDMIMFNRSALIAILFTEIFFPAGVIGLAMVAAVKGEINIFAEHFQIFIPMLFGLNLPIVFFYAKLRRPSIFYPDSDKLWIAIIFGLTSLGINVFLVNICISLELLNHLYFIAHLAGGVVIMPKTRKSIIYPPLLISIPVIFYALTFLWHTKNPPLMQLWPWAMTAMQLANLISFAICITLLVYYLAFESKKSESALEIAHQESEKLLLNILPVEVSLELKAHGHTIPREYTSTTVLFTDFVGFTRIAEKLTASDLVRELDQCFSYFDNVAQKYGLEKLKTIGDAYMAVGGIPIENYTHPIDCALAALEIQAFMNQMKEIKEEQGLPYWELRLGMHTGPLVAGVVGEKKFAYDVWGDTVNTASRMESSGEPGAINISRELYDRLRFLFACKYRGKVYAKNKGEIEMYFLCGLQPKFSIGGGGRVPNDRFKEIYEKIRAGATLIKKRPALNPETA